MREKPNFTEIVCIAHNAQALDFQFILKELAESSVVRSVVRQS